MNICQNGNAVIAVQWDWQIKKEKKKKNMCVLHWFVRIGCDFSTKFHTQTITCKFLIRLKCN